MGGRVRGIGRSQTGEMCIVTGSRREGSIYRDQITGTDFYYKGQGLRGDQRLWRGNKYLAQALNDALPVRVFRFETSNVYRYMGKALPVNMDWIHEEDADGKMRKVIVFTFRMLDVSQSIE